MRRSRLRLLGVGAAVALAVSACGSGGRGDNPEGSGAGAGATASAASTAGGTFGTLASPCGGGSARGATDQGVTDTTITIGHGDDRGFTGSPGLNHEMGDATTALIKWCNDQGGINGRKIVGKFYDAKITEANNVTTDACSSVFMLVGEGWALDSAAEQTRVRCNLVATEGFSVSPEFANGPMQYQGVPNPADVNPASSFAQMAKLYPDKVKKAALYTSTLATQNYSEQKAIEASKKFGWNWLDCTQKTNYTGEPDYRPFMQKLKDCGAEVVYTAQSPGPPLFNALQAANQVGFQPIWLGETNLYTQDFAKFNRNNVVHNFYSRLAFIPTELAAQVPAVQKYIDIVKANGGDVNTLGEQSASSFLLWATAAKACGSTLTRQCMVDKLSAVKDWTAGGLHAPTNPGENLPPSCGLLVKLQGSSWEQAYPEKKATFDCSPTYPVRLSGPVTGVTLNSDRLTTKYLTDKIIIPRA
jgi:ABC-type branched-subunit amino acid transport system substrate-binding protein